MLSLINPLKSAALSLGVLLVSASGDPALGQTAQDDPFSILAPSASPPDTTAAEAPAAAAHLDRESYLALRGTTAQTRRIAVWQVDLETLDGTPVSRTRREIGLGDDFAYEQTEDGRHILDFRTDRSLNISEAGVTNMAIAAHVHRQMNTFMRFTQNGTLEEVAGPGGATFERFWIEAALGVRAGEVTIYADNDADGTWLLRRRPDTPPIARLTPGEQGDTSDARQFAGWLRHNAPIHPDVLSFFSARAELPETFSFIVFSPSSPDGRRETWTLQSLVETPGGLPWPETAGPAEISAYALPNEEMTELVAIGLAAADARASREAQAWIDQAAARRAAHDKAGAYLTLVQAGEHYGACNAASSTPVCSALNLEIVRALGNDEMETLITAVSAGIGDPEGLIAALAPFAEREDEAGAAANGLTARATAALEIRGEAVETSPVLLFLNSARADPDNPAAYWHAGRYAAANDDLDTAWLLFDIARSLRAPMAETAVRGARALEDRLESIAPAYFGPGDTPTP